MWEHDDDNVAAAADESVVDKNGHDEEAYDALGSKPLSGAALECSVTITDTFGHFSLNGYAKHWENRYFLKFVNQIWPKVSVLVTLQVKNKDAQGFVALVKYLRIVVSPSHVFCIILHYLGG